MAPGDLDSIHDILPPPRYILTSRELTKHHLTSLVRHIIPAGIVLVCCLVVHCMQYLHVLAVQRSLTVVRPSQAFHDAICEYSSNVRDFFDSGVQDMYRNR